MSYQSEIVIMLHFYAILHFRVLVHVFKMTCFPKFFKLSFFLYCFPPPSQSFSLSLQHTFFFPFLRFLCSHSLYLSFSLSISLSFSSFSLSNEKLDEILIFLKSGQTGHSFLFFVFSSRSLSSLISLPSKNLFFSIANHYDGETWSKSYKRSFVLKRLNYLAISLWLLYNTFRFDLN